MRKVFRGIISFFRGAKENMRGKFKKSILIICLSLFIALPVYASEDTDNKEQTQEQVVDESKQQVEIEEEEVPLGLESMATFERYKRDVVVMIVFGSLVVVTTIAATIKEKNERKKLN